MKHFNIYSCLLTGTFLLTSCYSSAEDSDDEVIAESAKQTVRVVTRASSNSDLTYPIQIYALDANGVEKAHQTLTSESDKLSLSLAQGTYRIVAYCGEQTMPSVGYSTTPVMYGSADAVVGSQPVTVSLLLSYQVCSLNVTLTDVPDDASAVSMSVSSQYTHLSLDGTFSHPQAVTLPLTQASGVWSTGTCYVMPGSGQQTSFSISVVTPSGQQTYGYTYGSALRVATPYSMTGNYESGDGQITGILSTGSWSPTVDIHFSFGEGADNEVVTPTDDATVSLDGHVVAFADTTETQYTYLLISLADYTKVHSYSGDATEAATLATSYNENGLMGWRIPTEDEAKRLKSQYYGSSLTALNTQITSAGGTAIWVTDSKGDSYRYLCANATKTYQFKTGTSVTSAGATVTYGLRLVRTVTISR